MSQPTLDSPVIVEDSRPRQIFQPGHWRSFAIYERNAELNVFEGRDTGVAEVVEYLKDIYSDAQATQTEEGYHARTSAGVMSAGWSDAVVWEGFKVQAVFRPQGDGSAEITRYDQRSPARGGNDWLASVIRAALELGEDEAIRRVFKL